MSVLIHQPTRSVLLTADDPFAIREAIPRSKTIDHPAGNIAVQHTITSTRVLRNMGYDVPMPFDYQYRWPGKYTPMGHQRKMVDFYAQHRRCFNLSEPGTGKTAGTLWGADVLMEAGLVSKALVLAPLSTLETVWLHDIHDVLMHRKGVVVHGTRDQRRRALRADVDFYITNHDGVKIGFLAKAIRDNPDIDLIIVDEGSEFRNEATDKYKALAAMLRPDMRIWWITGTPVPTEPTDAWAQARIICPERVPRFAGAFKRQVMMQITPFKWVPKKEGVQAAFDALQPAVRFVKAECMDLPPVTVSDRMCDLTKEQRDLYRDMHDTMVMEAKLGQITAVNAADKITKLRQVLCGAVKDPESGKYLPIPHGPRLELLKECIRGARAKVVVVVPFTGIIHELAKDLEPAYDATGKQTRDGWSTAILNGEVPPHKRAPLIQMFKEQADPHVLLCHPRVMSHGLNLTEADTTIIYGPIYSNNEFQQVIERFNRAGQKNKMSLIRMAAHPLEWSIYKVLDNRRDIQQNVLDLYMEVVET